MPNDFKCPYCSHTAELNDSTYLKVKSSFELSYHGYNPPKDSEVTLVFLNVHIAMNIALTFKGLVLK